jgi:hypothetical protein
MLEQHTLLPAQAQHHCVYPHTCKPSGAPICLYFKIKWLVRVLRANCKLRHYSGQFVIEYVGEVINYKEFRRRFENYSGRGHKHFYLMSLSSDQVCRAIEQMY